MASNVGVIEAEIRANTQKLSTDLSRAKMMFGNTTKSIGNTLLKLRNTILLVGGAFATFSAGKDLIKVASDFEEAQGKMSAVFGAIRDDALATAKELSKSYNMSILDSVNLLSSTADLLTGFGMQKDKALELSKSIQQLAADLASFQNLEGGAKRASEILTKALLGERDALVSLGVKVSENDVKTELLKDKYKELKKENMMLAKAQATYNLILAQTKNAQGDVARTGGSFANQVRKLNAMIMNLKISLGKQLLPIATKVVVWLNKIVSSGGFNKLINAIYKTFWKVAGFLSGFVSFVVKIGNIFVVVAESVAKAFDTIFGKDVSEKITKVREEIEQTISSLEKFKAKAEAKQMLVPNNELPKQKNKPSEVKPKFRSLDKRVNVVKMSSSQQQVGDKLVTTRGRDAEVLYIPELVFDLARKYRNALTTISKFLGLVNEDFAEVERYDWVTKQRVFAYPKGHETESLSHFFSLLKKKMDNTFDDMKKWFESVRDITAMNFEKGNEFGGPLLGAVSGAYSGAKKALSDVISALKGVIAPFNGLAQMAGDWLGILTSLVSKSSQFAEFMSAIEGPIIELADMLGEFLSPAFQILGYMLRRFAQGIAWLYDHIVVPVANGIIKVFNAIFKAIDSIPFVSFKFRLEELKTTEAMKEEREERDKLTKSIQTQASAFENLSQAIKLDVLRARMLSGVRNNRITINVNIEGDKAAYSFSDIDARQGGAITLKKKRITGDYVKYGIL